MQVNVNINTRQLIYSNKLTIHRSTEIIIQSEWWQQKRMCSKAALDAQRINQFHSCPSHLLRRLWFANEIKKKKTYCRFAANQQDTIECNTCHSARSSCLWWQFLRNDWTHAQSMTLYMRSFLCLFQINTQSCIRNNWDWKNLSEFT